MPDPTSTTPEQPPEDPDDATDTAAQPLAPSPAKSVRYSAYDQPLARFVGGVHATKKAVAEDPQVVAAKKAGDKLEVREV